MDFNVPSTAQGHLGATEIKKANKFLAVGEASCRETGIHTYLKRISLRALDSLKGSSVCGWWWWWCLISVSAVPTAGAIGILGTLSVWHHVRNTACRENQTPAEISAAVSPVKRNTSCLFRPVTAHGHQEPAVRIPC